MIDRCGAAPAASTTCDGNSACPPVMICDACPKVYGVVEGLYMRSEPHTRQQPVVIDLTTRETRLSTSDLGFGFDGGVRVTAGIRGSACRSLEFSYMGLFDSQTSASVTATTPQTVLTFPGALGPASNVFFGADRIDVNYHSRLHSFEFNLPCCCCCCDDVHCRSFEWFTGFRYVSLDDQLDILGQREEHGGIERGNYNIGTRNNLFGAQFGVRVRRGWGSFRWELTSKAGIFGNDAEQSQSVVDFPNFLLRPPVSNNRGQTAFVGELNLTAVYRLNEVWGVRLGYNMLWIEGLALAPDQLDFTFTNTSGSGINNFGGLFVHGLSTGFEARW
jgi:hypothetical protein